jgi:hypothetical protein
MGLFGRKRKKEEDEFDEEEGFNEEEELKDRKLNRKFRDLNPENRRKRKEPPKPWGKKERILVLGFILATTILALGMYIASLNLKLGGLPKISIPKINLQNPFGEEVIKVGPNSVK